MSTRLTVLRIRHCFSAWLTATRECVARRTRLHALMRAMRVTWLRAHFVAWRRRIVYVRQRRAQYLKHATFYAWKLHTKRVTQTRKQLRLI